MMKHFSNAKIMHLKMISSLFIHRNINNSGAYIFSYYFRFNE